MRKLTTLLLACALLAPAVHADALSLPHASVLFRRLGLNVPPSADEASVPQAVGGPVAFIDQLLPGIWARLPKATVSQIGQFYGRTDEFWGHPDWLSDGTVHVLTYGAAKTILNYAVSNGLTELDLFTDSVFRNPKQVFFIPGPLAVRLFREYSLPGPVLAEGYDQNTGSNFQVLGIILGAGHIAAVYPRSLKYTTPPSMQGAQTTYRCDSVLEQTIVGPGDVMVNGLTAYAYGFW
ncbi:MAG: hypothetical protein KGK30_09175, partial [Elusimicrobia bacterium]|nr:hypothetical protein [Elusimicrobiota bacterium]